MSNTSTSLRSLGTSTPLRIRCSLFTRGVDLNFYSDLSRKLKAAICNLGEPVEVGVRASPRRGRSPHHHSGRPRHLRRGTQALLWIIQEARQVNVTGMAPIPVSVSRPCLPHKLVGTQYPVSYWNERPG